jgi:hypothetical protein
MSTTPSPAHQDDKPNDKQDITVTVSAPRAPDARTFTWSKHLTVGEATADAAAAFGYAGDVSLSRKGVKLDPSKQLVAAGVRDGDELRLIDTGGGV